jgi:Protein of unknown function (DUF4232)
MRIRLLALGLLVTLLVVSFPAASAQAQNCQFVLGFATLHNLIPQIVGQCLENEHHNAVNGDGLQATTNGLLVWRKSDNFTAFTDGFRTSVNGPFGVQMRLNSQRFFWEQNPDKLPIIPTPVAGDRCHTAGLSLAVNGSEGAAGTIFVTFRFTNNLGVSCTFFGFVGAQMLDSQNNPVPTQVIRGGDMLTNLPGPATVTVPAGGAADFTLSWSDVPVGGETTCPQATQLAVIPPNEFSPLIVPVTLAPCNFGTVHVSAVRPPS